MRATFAVRGEQLTDGEVYDRFVGNAAPGVDMAEAIDELTAEGLNHMFQEEDPYTDHDAAEVRAAVRQYTERNGICADCGNESNSLRWVEHHENGMQRVCSSCAGMYGD